MVQIFFDQWLRNYYGETLLYNEDGMVCAGIHPRRGRLAVFPASVRRLLHPPAIDYMSHQHIIEVRDRYYDNGLMEWYCCAMLDPLAFENTNIANKQTCKGGWEGKLPANNWQEATLSVRKGMIFPGCVQHTHDIWWMRYTSCLHCFSLPTRSKHFCSILRKM